MVTRFPGSSKFAFLYVRVIVTTGTSGTVQVKKWRIHVLQKTSQLLLISKRIRLCCVCMCACVCVCVRECVCTCMWMRASVYVRDFLWIKAYDPVSLDASWDRACGNYEQQSVCHWIVFNCRALWGRACACTYTVQQAIASAKWQAQRLSRHYKCDRGTSINWLGC